MSLLILLSIVILLLSIMFLGLSIAMILKKYTLKGTITSVFFLIFAVKYLVFLYYELAGVEVNLLVFMAADFILLLSLLALMISR